MKKMRRCEKRQILKILGTVNLLIDHHRLIRDTLILRLGLDPADVLGNFEEDSKLPPQILQVMAALRILVFLKDQLALNTLKGDTREV